MLSKDYRMSKNNNKKILITGSSGFLGSHVVDVLYNKGCEIVLFDKYPSKYKQRGYIEILGDILNKNDVNEAMKGCDFVYHFAAQADINISSNNPPLSQKNDYYRFRSYWG